MTREWAQHAERGSRFMVRFIRWVALHIGRPLARGMLHPIAFYFVIMAPIGRRESIRFFTQLRGRKAGWLDAYRHIHCFSATILDRVFLLIGRFSLFDLNIDGIDIPHSRIKKGQGVLLLGSHLGSTEIFRALNNIYEQVPMKMLTQWEQNPQITELLEAINPGVKNTVINLSQPHALLEAKEYLDNGYVVAMLGDRFVKEDDALDVEFLGRSAKLPMGPLRLAAVLKVPVIMFFGLYRGDCRYDIHFELLAEKIELDRSNREASLRPYVETYMRRIEPSSHFPVPSRSGWVGLITLYR